jgi:hypothetical protein
LNLPQFRRGEVQKFIKLIWDQFRRIDGFWFLGVENKFGYQSAIELNDEVSNRMGRPIISDIKG